MFKDRTLWNWCIQGNLLGWCNISTCLVVVAGCAHRPSWNVNAGCVRFNKAGCLWRLLLIWVIFSQYSLILVINSPWNVNAGCVRFNKAGCLSTWEGALWTWCPWFFFSIVAVRLPLNGCGETTLVQEGLHKGWEPCFFCCWSCEFSLRRVWFWCTICCTRPGSLVFSLDYCRAITVYGGTILVQEVLHTRLGASFDYPLPPNDGNNSTWMVC